MSTVKVKKDNVAIVFGAILTTDGVPVDLAGTSVEFVMRKGAIVVSGAANTVIGTTGRVIYTTQPGDLATVGTFKQEWKVTFSDGRVYTFPSTGFNKVVVIADLDE